MIIPLFSSLIVSAVFVSVYATLIFITSCVLALQTLYVLDDSEVTKLVFKIAESKRVRISF